MSEAPHRVAFVLTHPVQYLAPWFREMARHDQVELTVLYGTQPTPEVQAAGFGGAFEWDIPLLEGYQARVLAPECGGIDVHADRFSRLDAPGLEASLVAARPEVVVVPGWHAALYLRALDICRRRGWPAIYRGDSTLRSGPDDWSRPVWRLHTRRRLRRYAAWLAVGTRADEYLAAFGVPEPLRFRSPHAVDNERFAVAAREREGEAGRALARKRLGVPLDARVVLFAGKLSGFKRPGDVIRAVHLMARPAHVLFAGAGDEEPACRRLAASLGVEATFAGFLNQSRMPDAYATADVLVLPSSGRETWGLVVNEALASGVPCVVSDQVGSGPDLVDNDLTGRIVPFRDVPALAHAIESVLSATEHAGRLRVAAACRERVATHSFARATAGLVAACDRLRRHAGAAQANRSGRPRIVAACGQMVIAGGLERMTVGVLRVCRARGAAVSVIVNGWGSAPIMPLVEEAGADWVVGRYWETIRWPQSPRDAWRLLIEIGATSAGLLREVRRFDASHVLIPDWVAAVRNAPALLWLRARGVGIVMRVGNAPASGRWHGRLWRWVLASSIDRFVANSRYLADQVAAAGVPRRRIEVVPNAPMRQIRARSRPVRDPWRVIYVGQIIPPKGVDLLLEAVAQLLRAGLFVTLEIVGDIDGWESPTWRGYRAALRRRAAAADLSGAVTFAGAVDDVMDRLLQASVHCCPSRPEQQEGMVSVVLEAKLAGIPSVVTPTGALPELVRHGIDGWVAREVSPEALAEGLRHFLTDAVARARAGEAARGSLEAFSPERFAASWARVFGLAEGPSPVAREARVS